MYIINIIFDKNCNKINCQKTAKMENDTVTINWLEGMSFNTETDNFHIVIDAHNEFGGKNKGPKPKKLLLTSLGGCTSMDVVSMLNKMRVKFDKFVVKVSGELTNDIPKYYNRIHVIYEVTGEKIPKDKIKKAVGLSEEKYCGVNFMLKQTATITSEIKINGKII